MRYTVLIPEAATPAIQPVSRMSNGYTALPMPSKYSIVDIAFQVSFTEPFIFYEYPQQQIVSVAGWERFLRQHPNAVVNCGPIEQLISGFFEKARLAQRYRKRLPNYKKVQVDLLYRFDQDGFQFYKVNEKV